jgi:hemerythrin
VSERTQALTEKTQALADANQQLDDIANTDVLTDLPNRRHAMRSFQRAWLEAASSNTALACMMIDADGFKQINDTQGHDAGDRVLQALSMQLRNAVRTDDLVCRLGGDEFLIICAATPMDGALQLAEKIRSDVAALRVNAGAGEWRGSVSIGVAVRTAEMSSMEDLLKTADLGVYAAKRNGRNCVAVAD